MPKRIQLRRTKGWRKPEGAIVVARPSKWGSPYPLSLYEIDYSDELGYNESYRRTLSVSDFRGFLDGRWELKNGCYPDRATIRAELRGHDLACWCPIGEACHANVLLEVANS